MQVYYSDHSHALSLILLNASSEISHIMNLEQRVNVNFELVDISHHQTLNSFLPQIYHQKGYEWNTDEDYSEMAINYKQLHENGVYRHPEIDKYETAAKDANESVVVRDLLIVLIAEGAT